MQVSYQNPIKEEKKFCVLDIEIASKVTSTVLLVVCYSRGQFELWHAKSSLHMKIFDKEL